jgi:hypothetical protein
MPHVKYMYMEGFAITLLICIYYIRMVSIFHAFKSLLGLRMQNSNYKKYTENAAFCTKFNF